jgi:hypothetical protein
LLVNLAAKSAMRPICTPWLPSSRPCALDFFLAGESYDLLPETDLGSRRRYEPEGRTNSDRASWDARW